MTVHRHRRRYGRSRRVCVAACLLTSLLIHLIGGVFLMQLEPRVAAHAFRSARLPVSLVGQVRRFEVADLGVAPKMLMREPRKEMGVPAPAQSDLPSWKPFSPRSPPSAVESVAGKGGFVGTEALDGEASAAAREPKVSVVEEERQKRWLRALQSADTTSALAQARRRAEAIVDRAIEAMGGLQRLAAVEDVTIREEVWDSDALEWNQGPTRYYRRGVAFREDRHQGLRQGFDGKVSYVWRYGVLRRPPNLQRLAERWDFLSRYRGDGIVVQYLRSVRVHDSTRDVIRVIDTKFGVEMESQFDASSGLLVAEIHGDSHSEIIEYRPANGILWPHLIGSAARIPYLRRWTSVNDGLAAGFFDAPAERQWAAEDVQRIIRAHVSSQGLPLVALKPFFQAWQPDTPTEFRASAETLELLDLYLRRKLAAAGILSSSGQWHLEASIDRYYEARIPPFVWRQIEIKLAIVHNTSADSLWTARLVRRWPLVRYPEVNDVLADDLTMGILELLSRGLRYAEERVAGAGGASKGPKERDREVLLSEDRSGCDERRWDGTSPGQSIRRTGGIGEPTERRRQGIVRLPVGKVGSSGARPIYAVSERDVSSCDKQRSDRKE